MKTQVSKGFTMIVGLLLAVTSFAGSGGGGWDFEGGAVVRNVVQGTLTEATRLHAHADGTCDVDDLANVVVQVAQMAGSGVSTLASWDELTKDSLARLNPTEKKCLEQARQAALASIVRAQGLLK